MPIQVGDKLPSVTLQKMQDDKVISFPSDDLFAGKKVILFALPGAFTPTCSAHHLPGFLVRSDDLFAAGIDQIACLSVNDAFVMHAWGISQNVEDKILMIGDGSAEFTSAIGLTLDLMAGGMGIRSKRYAMIINDGVVETLNIEEKGEFKVSDADTMLHTLKG
jgi:glutaredoxin/glutathione-dependent peroxiredoxin